MNQPMIAIPPAQAPLLADVDLLVLGGGLAGLPVARRAAQDGRKVWLVTPYTFLGDEIGVWQRPWLRWDARFAALAGEWFGPALPQGTPAEGSILPLHPDRLKRRLEDILLEAGVELLYASYPVACTPQEDGWQVVLGNKSGRQAIRARQVVDATLFSTLARLLRSEDCTFLGAQAGEEAGTEPLVVRRTLDFTQVVPPIEGSYAVPEALGVYQNRIEVYPGAFSKEHVILDIPMRAPAPYGQSIAQDIQVEASARRVSLEAAAYLVQYVPTFRNARLGLGSLQVCPQPGCDPLLRLAHGQANAEAILGEDGAGCWNAGRQDAGRGNSRRCFVFASPSAIQPETPVKPTTEIQALLQEMPPVELREESEFRRFRRLPQVPIPAAEVPLQPPVEVLVVGGGTSGAMAAITAAQEGAQTALVEMNPALGGTGTLGGVNVYWFGNRNAFTRDIDRRVREWQQKLAYPQVFYVWGKKDAWSLEIKAFALLEWALDTGVTLYFNCLTMGTLVQEDQVAGVLAATPYGPAAFRGKVIVDATGDGDVAAFAGAELRYGNARDRMTLWAAVCYFSAPGVYRAGNFTTTVDVGDILDYTRFFLAGRRRGGEELYDHSPYIAPRESRHIQGEIVLTLTDQLLMRKFPDTVSLCFSNHDPKGLSGADIVYFGLLPPHLEIEIPYRALLPEKLDGLLIAGKAFSCTHDALAAARMMDDLQQQGGAVGLAAALCVRQGCRPRDLEVHRLQKRLERKGLLRREMLGPQRKTAAPDYAEIVRLLTGDEPFDWNEMSVREKADSPSPLAWLCAAEPGEVAPLLLEAHASATGKRRLLLARLLVWHGQEAGLQEVIGEIERILAAEPGLPKRSGSLRFFSLPPDHGLMPEITTLVNLLAWARSEKAIPVLDALVERIEQAGGNYGDKRQMLFNHVYSIAYVSERLGLPACIPLLERLLRLPKLQNQVKKAGFEVEILGERLAYLVMSLNRALARCGSRQGLLGLAEFTADNRILLARSACDELRALTRLDYGNQAERWKKALENWPERFEPQPWTTRMD